MCKKKQQKPFFLTQILRGYPPEVKQIMIKITTYQPSFKDAIATLITSIQQGVFGVPITLQDQPDLMNIDTFYQQKNGNFWCALNEEKEVVGTIALIDVGQSFGTIRKMFVREDYRGSDKGVAASLLHTLQNVALENGMNALYLGTFDKLKASHRFYDKNGFTLIQPNDLPENFPRMQVDNVFFMKNL